MISEKTPTIMAFSGSPIPNSNTDRLVKHIIENSGESYEFVKLSDYHISPCRACKGCVKTNRCVIKDDFHLFADKIKQADAVILGTYTPYSVMDGFIKSLLERFFSMRHYNSLLKDKFIVSTVTSTYGEVRAQAHRSIVLESVAEKMRHVGMIDIDGSNPCLTCGAGKACMNSIQSRLNADVDFDSSDIIAVENQKAWQEAEELGRKLGRLIRNEEEYVSHELTREIEDGMKLRYKAKRKQMGLD